MNYMKYNRTFVMLEEQTKEFSAKEAPVKGYLKVETGNNKGALRCVVQNLRYYDHGDYIYKLILFGKKQGQTIHAILGGLILNRNGNGETYFRFNPLDVDGKGNDYHDFSAAIVAAASGNNKKEPLHPVLKGVMQAESHLVSREQEDSDAAIRHDKASGMEEHQYREEELASERGGARGPEMAQMTCPEPEPMQEPCPEPGVPRMPCPGPEPEPIQRPVRPEDSMREDESGQSPGASPRPPRKYRYDKERVCFNSFYNESLLEFCGYICKAADHFEEVMPFERDLTGARWKKIINVEDLPLTAPGAHYFSRMYQHFLLGAKPGNDGYADEFYLAVPGRFTREEQPDGGRSGFVYWQPVAGAAREKEAYGYWIVAIDAGNGDILEVSPAI